MAETKNKEALELLEEVEQEEKKPQDVKEALVELTKRLSEINFSKDGKNPIFKSDYITIDQVLRILNPILSDIGLNLQQNPEGEDDIKTITYGKDIVKNIVFIRMRTILTFVNEKGESSSVEYLSYPNPVELQIKGNLSQALGSAITYLRRYHLMSVLGIGTGEDDDGNALASQNTQNTLISKLQEQTIEAKIKEISEKIGMDHKQLLMNILNEYGLTSLSKLKSSKFNEVMDRLNRTR